jgi:hypothetical protein
VRTGGSYRIVINGREYPAFDDICRLQFSPDGTHLYYGARTGRALTLETVNAR